jgi:hypothetical protein
MYTRSGRPAGLIDCHVIPSAEPQSSVVGEPSFTRTDNATIPAGPAATLTRLALSSPGNISGRAAQTNDTGAGLDGLGLGSGAKVGAAVGGKVVGDAADGVGVDGAHPSTAIAPSSATPAKPCTGLRLEEPNDLPVRIEVDVLAARA